MWIAHLADISADAAAVALSLLFESDEFRPSFARFGEIARAEQRMLEREDRNRDYRERGPAGRPVEGFSKERSLAVLKIIRLHLTKAEGHEGPLVDCLLCAPERAALAAARPMGHCRSCYDTGMVVVDDEGRRTARPCQMCNEPAYRLWEGGHFEPDHSICSECTTIRRKPVRELEGA